MDFWTFLIMIGVVAVIFVTKREINISKRRKAMDAQLDNIENFSASQKFIGMDGKTGIAIDEQRNKICLINHLNKKIHTCFLEYKDLLAAEIFEDGITVTKTVRSSQMGSALIGGLALGGVGALIGGLSGKKESVGKVKKIDLRLTVNITSRPLHDISFLDDDTKKDGIHYRQVMQQVRHWHGLMEVLIKRVDLEDKDANKEIMKKPLGMSVADEIKKLAELRDSGVLSNEEFHEQKMKLLDA